MKKITIYTDCHYFTPMEMRCIPTDLSVITKENAYSIGDNYDRKGCEPSQANLIEKEYKAHKILFKGRFITGNHDVMKDKVEDQYLAVDGVLFVHGDFAWGSDKANAFRNEAPYQGFSSVKKLLNWGRKLFPGNLSNSEAREAAALAKKHNCKTIIFGHTHCKNLQDKTMDGVRVINCPRGRTELMV
jgi:predicted phosphodiesterase